MDMITSEIVNKSIDYIMEHLAEEITIDDVAKHCHFSKYYFSRIFKAETGESIYAFMKRLKVDQSAIRLKIEKDKSITDIGYDYGYSPSNYSSVFKQHLKQSPAEFRKRIPRELVQHPFVQEHVSRFKAFKEYDELVTIQEFEDFLVIYERYIGNYTELEGNWAKFTEKYRDYFTEATLLIERSYDDPSITSVDQCLYDICMTVEGGCPLDNVMTIHGGKYAVYRFDGVVNDIFSAFQGLFNVWLPGSKYEMDERYGLDIYRAVDCDTYHVVMDLCIPIK
jgi:AraC family transcriptional regulator